MNGLQHHLTRSAALAALLLAGGGVAAAGASAAAPVVGYFNGGLVYAGDFAADVDDVVAFDPGVVNGTKIVDVRAGVNMRLDSSAAALCVGNGANVIRCEAAGVTDVMAQVGGGDDSVTLLPAGGADPVLRLSVAGGAGDDTLVGGGDDDSLAGEGGHDAISGIGGEDVLVGGLGDDELDGGAGHDELEGGAGHDELAGGDGADLLTDALGNDRLLGGAGRDRLDGGPGSDRLDGGADADVADYRDRTEPVAVSLDGGTVADDGSALDDADGDGPATVRDRVLAVESVYGGAGNDDLSSTEEARSLHGGPGDDRLVGGPALDILAGDDGADLLIGNGALDAYFGGAGDDEVRSQDGIAEPNLDCGAGAGDRVEGDPDDGMVDCEARIELPPVDAGGPGGEGGVGGPEGPGGAGGPVGSMPGGESGPSGAGDAGGGAGGQGGSGTPGGPGSGGGTAGRRSRSTPALDVRLARGRRGARVMRLIVRRVPAGATVTVTCKAPGRAACPVRRSRTRHRAGAERLDLRARVGTRPLPYGAVVTVRVGDPAGADSVRRVPVRRR